MLVAGCGGSDDEPGDTPQLILERAGGDEEPPGDAPPPTFPNTATANTVRVAGRNTVEDAAGVASAVFPATDESTRPSAVTLLDQADWQAGVAASVLAYRGEIGAPILLTDGNDLPAPTAGTLSRLDPTGAELADNAQVIAVGGGVPEVEDRRTTEITGADPFELAAEIDRFSAAAEGEASDNVMIASGDESAYAMPAAAWAARSGDAVLFTEQDTLPEATIEALGEHENPDIYVLGPESVISPEVEEQLDDLGGRVERVQGETPVENAIEFARYRSGSFGWGLVTPGHNFTLVSDSRPGDAAAAAALAGNGTYAPLLLTDAAAELPDPLRSYFLDIQPGFEDNPNSGVFNRVWILGDQSTVSLSVQAAVDELTELIPVQIDEEPQDGGGRRDPPRPPDDRDGGGGGSDEDIPENLPDDAPDDDIPGPGPIPEPQGPGLPGDDV